MTDPMTFAHYRDEFHAMADLKNCPPEEAEHMGMAHTTGMISGVQLMLKVFEQLNPDRRLSAIRDFTRDAHAHVLACQEASKVRRASLTISPAAAPAQP